MNKFLQSNMEDVTSRILREYIGEGWQLALQHTDYQGTYGVMLGYKLDPFSTKSVEYQFTEAIFSLKVIKDLIQDLDKEKEIRKKLEEEVKLYRSILPNLAVSLSDTGGYGV